MTRQCVTPSDVRREEASAEKAALAAAEDQSSRSSTRKIAAPGRPPDGYLDRFLKYIPSEVIVIYVTVLGPLGAETPRYWQWVAYGICQVGTPLFLWQAGGVTKWRQLVLATISFFVWASTTQGPFQSIEGWNAIWIAVFLPLYTFAVPFIQADNGKDGSDASTNSEDAFVEEPVDSL